MKKNEMLEMVKGYNYEYTLGKDYEDDILNQFNEYEDGYICDVISEIGDSNIPFSNHELLSSISDMQEWIDEAVFQFGMPDSKDSSVIIKLSQYGYYIYHTQILYDNLDKLIHNYVIDYLIENVKYELLRKKDIEYLLERVNEFDNNDEINDIIDIINEYITYVQKEVLTNETSLFNE